MPLVLPRSYPESPVVSGFAIYLPRSTIMNIYSLFLLLVSFSRSGRFIFAGYEDNNIRGWDVTADPAAGCCMHLGEVI